MEREGFFFCFLGGKRDQVACVKNGVEKREKVREEKKIKGEEKKELVLK